jgi:hypothetical protein
MTTYVCVGCLQITFYETTWVSTYIYIYCMRFGLCVGLWQFLAIFDSVTLWLSCLSWAAANNIELMYWNGKWIVPSADLRMYRAQIWECTERIFENVPSIGTIMSYIPSVLCQVFTLGTLLSLYAEWFSTHSVQSYVTGRSNAGVKCVPSVKLYRVLPNYSVYIVCTECCPLPSVISICTEWVYRV